MMGDVGTSIKLGATILLSAVTLGVAGTSASEYRVHRKVQHTKGQSEGQGDRSAQQHCHESGFHTLFIGRSGSENSPPGAFRPPIRALSMICALYLACERGPRIDVFLAK